MKKKVVGMLLILCSVGCMLYAGTQLSSYYKASRQEKALEDKIEEIAQSVHDSSIYEGTESSKEQGDGPNQKDNRENMREGLSEEAKRSLKEMNEDYVAWLDLPGTEISYPVVQRDNSFYLNHDFEGNKSGHGSIFLDEECTVDSNILMIHGHHMKDKTMFGGLSKYKKADYRKEHPQIRLDLGDGYRTYQIFATFVIDFTKEEMDVFHYEELPKTDEERKKYVEKLRSFAAEDMPPITEHSGILLLSTCDYSSDEARLVLAGVLE